jgi:hypothetical protein
LSLESRKIFIKRNITVISRLYNGVYIVYGPYNNSKDGRYRVVLYDGERKITRQYSKLKMEIKIGCRLGRDETVAHLDDNFHNDKYYNLAVIPRINHAAQDAIRVKRSKVTCAWCGNIFYPTRGQDYKKAGPFCSRRCTGYYGVSVQNGGNKIKHNKIKKTYYKLSGNSVS